MFFAKHVQHYPDEWLSLLFALFDQILDKSADAAKFALIQGCGRIFALCLPGSTILVPKFLKTYKEFSVRIDVPSEVVTAMIQSMSSLVSFEKRYEETSAESAHFECLKSNRAVIKVILQNLLQTHSSIRNYEHCEAILWLFGLYVIEDKLNQQVPISDPIIILLDNIAFRDVRMACAATDSLSLIAANSKRLGLVQEDIVVILDRILFSVPDHLSHGKNKKEISITSNVN